MDDLFNGNYPTAAPTGSVRDVYTENSYGQMTLQSTVADWVDVPNTEQYYANGQSGDSTLWQALSSALTTLDATVDFNQFDTDNDDWIDAIAFLHSGYGAEWGGNDVDGTATADRIWSHRWNMSTWTSNEGVRVSAYHISPPDSGVPRAPPSDASVSSPTRRGISLACPICMTPRSRAQELALGG